MKKILSCVVCAVLLFTGSLVRSQTFTNYTIADGLSDNFVCGGVAIDSNNNKWFGTAAGVSKYNGTWTVYTTTDGLADNYILCIAVDISNNVWVGTNSGVSKFNGSAWTTYTTIDGLIDNSVNYIYADAAGVIWFATGVGLSKLDGSTWTNYTTTNGLSSDIISYITEDIAGNIWLGTQMGGYSKFDNATFTNFMIATIDSLVSDNVFAVAVDASNNQWVGSWSGMSKIDPSGTWIRNYRMVDGMYNDFIRDMKIGVDGDMWIGYFADYNLDGGISRFDGINWTSLSTPEGLADKQVIRLALDQQDNVWIATGNGVSMLNGAYGIDVVSNQEKVYISPNPASGLVSVNTSIMANKLRILNTEGQQVFEVLPTSNQVSIETADFSSGIYIVQLIFSDHVSCSKLIIK